MQTKKSPITLDNGVKIELSTSQDWSGTIWLDGEAEFVNADGEEDSVSESVDFKIDDYDQDEAEECFQEALDRLIEAINDSLE